MHQIMRWISNDGSRIIAQEYSTDRVALYSINGDTAVPVTPVAGRCMDRRYYNTNKFTKQDILI